MQELCPNCKQRPQEVQVDYDEVTQSNFRVTRSRVRGTVRSFSSTSQYGHAQLCTVCANRYRRMERWRALGWKMANRGLVAVMASGVFFALVVQTPALRTSALAYVAGGVVVLAGLAVLIGAIFVSGGRILRPSATRFLRGAPSATSKRVVTRQ